MVKARTQAIADCLAFIHSMNREAPLLDAKTIELHLDSALAELSIWRPCRRLVLVTFDPATAEYLLPDDFMSIDVESFNQAINPSGLQYSWSGSQYAMGRTLEVSQARTGIFTPPYALPGATSFGIMFSPGTRFEFAQNAEGVPVLYSSPRPARGGAVQFLAECRHQITDGVPADPDADPPVEEVPSINTVRPEDRGALWAKVGQLACLSLARATSADRYAPRALMSLADKLEAYWEKRTATFSYGM